MASKKISVPEAKAALDQFKMQAASEVGVTLNQNGYNGNLTSKQAGSIGGQMVNDVMTTRLWKTERKNRRAFNHKDLLEFEFYLMA